jgi:hypothetical protein
MKPRAVAPPTLAHPDILRDAVAAAVMAPSSHNTQPWRFRLIESTLELYADPGRQLHVIDADRRQQITSCGCALYNARVAVRARGFVDDVTVNLADSQDPYLLATLRLGTPHITTDLEHELVAAIPNRRTNRRPFLPRPVALDVTDAMIEAAAAEGATMVRLDPEQKHQLGHLIDEADRLQYGDPAFRAELAHWLRPTGSRKHDGIPFVEKEYGSALPFTVMRALRSPGIGDQFGALEDSLVQGAPVVAVIGTISDDPADWLDCGQALEAVLLRATALGMSAAFFNQVLEIPGLRNQVTNLVPQIGSPQMVFRLGYPEDAVHHPAPRRDLSDVLEVVESIVPR